MDKNKFNLWRASFSFCFVDGFLSPEEKSWIENKMNHLPFTPDQKSMLLNDLVNPPNISALLPQITSPVDRGFLVNNIRMLEKIDKDLNPSEKAKIEQVTKEILAKIDLVQLNQVIQDDEHASYHEDEVYKIDNKHSYTEAIVKRLSRIMNRGDYKYPEEE
jgi:hypothetical protein